MAGWVLDEVVQAVFVVHEGVEALGQLGEGQARLPPVLPDPARNGLRQAALPEAKGGGQNGQDEF
jgi:hypothetical protein